MNTNTIATATKTSKTQFVSAEGLAQLAEVGALFWQEATSHKLPHNLIRSQMSGSVGIVGPHGRKMPQKEAAGQIEHFARFGGWLREAANYRNLRKAIERGQSSNGINAMRTLFDLEAFFKLYKSPGYADFALYKARCQADNILSAFVGGRKASWASLAHGLVVANGNYRKAGVIAAASAVVGNGETFWSYRNARAFLESSRTALFDKMVFVNGTEYRCNTSSKVEVDGLTVYSARFTDKWQRYAFCYVVERNDGKLFAEHCNGTFPCEQLIVGSYAMGSLLAEAQESWAERDVLEEALYQGLKRDASDLIKVVANNEVPSSYKRKWTTCDCYVSHLALHDAESASIVGSYAHTSGDNTFLVPYTQRDAGNGKTISINIEAVYISEETDRTMVAEAINDLFSQLND